MNRRRILKLLAGSSVLTVMCACEEQDSRRNGESLMVRYPSIPPLSGEPTPHVRIHALLEELRLAFEAKGYNVSSELTPPISESKLRQKCSWFPGQLPPELISLYSWRGGQQIREHNEFSPFWFRDMIFSTPEVAKDEYLSMMETYGKYSTSEDSGIDLRTSFPFASFNGGWYVFPCGGQALDLLHPRAIVCVFQGIDAYFHSMESMIKTCIDWVNHPLYQVEPGDWQKVEIELWRKHNPGVFGQ
jgi:hypothetical protein